MKSIVEPVCKTCVQETDCQGCDIYNQAMEAFNKDLEAVKEASDARMDQS